MTQAVSAELRNNGYIVNNGIPGDDSAKTAVVSGEILNVFCDMYMSYTGQVSLITRVNKDGKEIFSKHFAGEGSAGLAWAGTGEAYAQSLALALSSAIKQFVSELDKSLATD